MKKRILSFIPIIAVFAFAVNFTGCSGNSKGSSAPATDYEADGDMELKVSIQAIDQFNIIEQVLKAIGQTAYWDERVINQEAYAAMVSFEKDNGNGKNLERWVVKSKMIVEDGVDVNKINAWIEEPGQLIKAQFKIKEGPSDTNPYGQWTLHVAFLDKTTGVQRGTFVASASLNSDGNVEVLLNTSQQEHGGPNNEEILWEQKGRLIINSDTGKGVVMYSDYHCDQGNCELVKPIVSYAYNADEVIVRDENALDILFNRNSYTDIYMDYNLYSSDGQNIKKSKSFGMPLKYTDTAANQTYYMCYGGWQGRHQLWGPEGVNPALGAQLYSTEYGQDNVTYSVAAKYRGYLVEKTLIDAPLNSIKGEKLQTWVNEGFNLIWDSTNSRWEKCNGANGPWDCSLSEDAAFDMSELVSDEDSHRWVWIGSPDGQLTYNGSGFDGGYIPENGDIIWVNISGPIIISYDGSSWIKYNGVTYNDWEPQINEDNYSPYTFDSDGKFYVNSTGINYVLLVTNNGTQQSLKKELENVIQPGTEANALNGTIFVSDGNEYSFAWNAANGNILLTDGSSNPVTQSLWYMEKKTDNPANTSYSWQYAENESETWNIMTYLKNAAGEWVFLDDPIYFTNVTGYDGNGTSVTLNNLGFDGRLFGVPDVWKMLEDSNWTLTEDMKGKIINIPACDVVGKDDSVTYKIKPRYGVRLLDTATPGAGSPSIDTSLTLDDLPAYVDPEIGDMPVIDTITVVEGEFVTQE